MVGASTWYRSDQQRYKSVYRRANPWYRRVARAVVGLAMIAVLAGLLYLGAQQVQDYLDRDKLPKPGQDAPEFASTSFLVTSSAPAPELNGTITFDTRLARVRVRRRLATGRRPGSRSSAPTARASYVRQDGGGWQVPADGDADVAAIIARRAVPARRRRRRRRARERSCARTTST